MKFGYFFFGIVMGAIIGEWVVKEDICQQLGPYTDIKQCEVFYHE